MRAQKGITLTSLIVYIIAMLIVVGSVTTMTKYFYGNIDNLTDRNQKTEGFTAFNSYFTAEVNQENNGVLSVNDEQTILIFTNGNQYTVKDETDGKKGIYFNKTKICSNVDTCTFSYDNDKKITVNLKIDGKNYNNVYTLKSK